MKDFDYKVISKCDFCRVKSVLCKEEVIETKNGKQKVIFVCEECQNKTIDEHIQTIEKLKEDMYKEYRWLMNE